MRIITGQAKGITLKTLEGEATRPTSSRVKEAVFSMLQFDIEGRTVLDLFAGSGQMALEALSRGARSADLVDKSKEAISVIKENIKKTNFSQNANVYQSDYLDYINKFAKKQFDIVFLDPPYALGMYKPSLWAMLKNNVLKPTTLIVCESNTDAIFENDGELEENFCIVKQSKYSKTVITVLRLRGDENEN